MCGWNLNPFRDDAMCIGTKWTSIPKTVWAKNDQFIICSPPPTLRFSTCWVLSSTQGPKSLDMGMGWAWSRPKFIIHYHSENFTSGPGFCVLAPKVGSLLLMGLKVLKGISLNVGIPEVFDLKSSYSRVPNRSPCAFILFWLFSPACVSYLGLCV